jgi:hypothetical protein
VVLNLSRTCSCVIACSQPESKVTLPDSLDRVVGLVLCVEPFKEGAACNSLCVKRKEVRKLALGAFSQIACDLALVLEPFSTESDRIVTACTSGVCCLLLVRWSFSRIA